MLGGGLLDDDEEEEEELDGVLVGLGFGVAVGAGVLVGGTTEVSARFGVAKLKPSAFIDGYQYRGLTARSLTLGVIASLPGSPLRGRVRVLGSFASYAGTLLLFFYPGIEFGPSVTVDLPGSLAIEWVALAGYAFRQDLDHAFYAGIEGRLMLEITRQAE